MRKVLTLIHILVVVTIMLATDTYAVSLTSILSKKDKTKTDAKTEKTDAKTQKKTEKKPAPAKKDEKKGKKQDQGSLERMVNNRIPDRLQHTGNSNIGIIANLFHWVNDWGYGNVLYVIKFPITMVPFATLYLPVLGMDWTFNSIFPKINKRWSCNWLNYNC